MKKLNKHITLISLILIICLAATGVGIFLIVRGVDFSEVYFIISGAVLVIFGFYGDITCIQRLDYNVKCKKIASYVENNRRSTVNDIAKQLKFKNSDVDKKIMYLIKSEFINGFYYNHVEIEKLEDREKRQREESKATITITKDKEVFTEAKKEEIENNRTHNEKCENCGATVSFVGRDSVCPYCGNLVIPRDQKK